MSKHLTPDEKLNRINLNDIEKICFKSKGQCR